MPKRLSVSDASRVGSIPDDELTIVLGDILPRGAQFRTDEVEYRTPSDELALTLRYHNGSVVDAFTGPAMTVALESQIATAIDQQIIATRGPKVYRCVAFSTPRIVEGHWRYGDDFQILPAPREAPRPKELSADHPFLIDLSFNDSSNFSIRQLRYARRATEVSLILNLTLCTGVTTLSNSPRKHWIWLPEQPLPRQTVWAQEGYLIPNFQFLGDEFEEPRGIAPISTLPGSEYYNFDTNRGDVLTVPTELAGIFDLFKQLDDADSARFLRACYWYRMAPAMWPYSKSMYLTALVNPVECLASLGPQRHLPEGPTALFLEFMRKHGPGHPGRNKVEEIYETRSRVTHGEHLFSWDLPSRPHGLSQNWVKDRAVGANATILCRGALLNWLWATSTSHREALVTAGLKASKVPKAGTKSQIRVILPGSNQQ
jgi:hypothetical protein